MAGVFALWLPNEPIRAVMFGAVCSLLVGTVWNCLPRRVGSGQPHSSRVKNSYHGQKLVPRAKHFEKQKSHDIS